MIKRTGKEYRWTLRDFGLDPLSYKNGVETEKLILGELIKGNTVIVKRRTTQSDWTWNKVVDWYLTKTSPTKARSWKLKGQPFHAFCETALGRTKIGSKRADHLTVVDLCKFMETNIAEEKPWRPKTVTMVSDTAHRCLRLGITAVKQGRWRE